MAGPDLDGKPNSVNPADLTVHGPARRHRIYTSDQAAELWGTSKEAVRDIAKRRPAHAPIAWSKNDTPFQDWVFDADRLDALTTAKYLERGELAPQPPAVDEVAEVMLPELPGADMFPGTSRFPTTATLTRASEPSPLDDPELRNDMALVESRESGRAEGAAERLRLEQLVEVKDLHVEKLTEENDRLREALNALVRPVQR